MRHRSLIALLFIIFSRPASAQTNIQVQKNLIIRYGSAVTWGNGYIVSANGFYGFADKKGKFIIPIEKFSFDTLLDDRASVSDYSSNHCLIDGNGLILSTNGYFPYKLVNRKRRLLSFSNSAYNTLMCDENGKYLDVATYHDHLPKGNIVSYLREEGYKSWYGLMNMIGDTILPAVYNSISIGNGIAGCIKNKTLYVYDKKGKLIFSMPDIHSCQVLENGLLVLEKYQAHALANSRGTLLTGFRYQKIEAFRYSWSTVPFNKQNSEHLPEIFPKYIRVNDDFPGGILDTLGNVVLPEIYEDIEMNSNGWLILNKKMSDKEDLVDGNFNVVLSADRAAIQFIDTRYASVSQSHGLEKEKARTFDMLLKKFVDLPPKAQVHETPLVNPETLVYERSAKKLQLIDRYDNDTLFINAAGTMLLRIKNQWGIVSITGDTIQPFIYDSVGTYGYRNFFIGRKGKLAYINWEGRLTSPLIFDTLPWYVTKDSLAIRSDRSVYSFKGNRLRKIDPQTEPVLEPYAQFRGGITYVPEASILKPGIYNRKLQFLAKHTYPGSSFPEVTMNGLFTIQDSLHKNITVIDSTGKKYFPWLPRPFRFWLFDTYAIAVNDTGKPDLLYRFEQKINTGEEIWLDPEAKKYTLYPVYEGDGWHDYHREINTWTFKKRNYGMGFVQNRGVLMIKGAEKIFDASTVALIRVKNKWGIYSKQGVLLVNPVYDSIVDQRGYQFLLYKKGKVGLYDYSEKNLIQPAYDSVYYAGSLRSHFFMTKSKNGKTDFIREDLKILSKGWEVDIVNWSESLCGFPVQRNGKKYKLFPTPGLSLEAVPEDTLPFNVKVVEDFEDQLSIVTKDTLNGVYDKLHTTWLIAPKHQRILRLEGHFAASDFYPPKLTLYSPEGKQLFSIPGPYYYPQKTLCGQWYLKGRFNAPIANNQGKIIVPEPYLRCSEIITPKKIMYAVAPRDGKYALIDTSGNVLIGPVLDYVYGQQMDGGYFVGSMNYKKSLIDAEGKVLTPFIYNSIQPGEPKKNSDDILDFNRYDQQTVAEKKHCFVVSLRLNEKDYKSERSGVVNMSGQQVVPCAYDSILEIIDCKVVVAKRREKWGLVDMHNKEITGFKYDKITSFYGGLIHFDRAGIKGYLSLDGKEEIWKR